MKKFIQAGIVSIVLFLVTAPVHAATNGTTDESVTISAGALTVTAPTVTAPFQSVVLDGNNQNVTSDLGTLAVGDSTGTGNGWNVMVSATQFTDEVGNTLPLGSLTLAQPESVVGTGGTTSAIPSILNGPFVIDDGNSYKILSAEMNEGMGNYDVTFPTSTLTLSLNPATTKIDTVDNSSTYSSTITFTIVTGP